MLIAARTAPKSGSIDDILTQLFTAGRKNLLLKKWRRYLKSEK